MVSKDKDPLEKIAKDQEIKDQEIKDQKPKGQKTEEQKAEEQKTKELKTEEQKPEEQKAEELKTKDQKPKDQKAKDQKPKEQKAKDQKQKDQKAKDQKPNKKKMPSNKNIDTKKDLDSIKEENYQKLIDLMKSVKCMTICKEKVDMYQNVAKQFSELSGYKDTDECAKVCKQLAKQANEEINKIIYNRAKNKKNTAKNVADYMSAAEEFRKVSGYKDADNMANECERVSIRIEKKASSRTLLKTVFVMLCVVAIIIGGTSSHAKYYLANAYKITGSYNSAIKMYKKLGAYKDCRENLIECQYLNGLDSEAEGDYKNAKKAFAAAGDYKDSEDKKVEMEKLIIKNSKVGNVVEVGNCKWTILDIKNDQVLLMKKFSLPGRAYNSSFGDVTWENSDLRQWLNSEFLEDTFTEKEQNNLILVNVKNDDNMVYGTDGGNNTKDYVYILSMGEVNEYKSLFPSFKRNSWLRSPGYNQCNAAFLSDNGSVMDYGYVTTSDEITVRPVVWFHID